MCINDIHKQSIITRYVYILFPLNFKNTRENYLLYIIQKIQEKSILKVSSQRRPNDDEKLPFLSWHGVTSEKIRGRGPFNAFIFGYLTRYVIIF